MYKVLKFEYKRSNSLLPPRDPTPEEEAPVEAIVISPEGISIIRILESLGWSEFHARSYYTALFTYHWYTQGIHDVSAINRKIVLWINTVVYPTIRQVRQPAPSGLPPQVIYFAVVVGVIMVVILLVAPEFEDSYSWSPSCHLYLGVYQDQLWWFTLAGVSLEQRPMYKAVSYSGGVIVAHTYHFITPPTVTDRFSFWGTVNFECWQVPWFRKYRLQYADCEHIGLCYHVAGDYYGLLDGGHDPFAPPGPVVIPPEDYCLQHSPCS